MTSAREFVDFWLKNCVHADEEMVGRRGRDDIQVLVDRLLNAGKDEGIDESRVKAEIGDIYAYIRASIDRQNVSETARLKLDGR